MTKVKFNGRKLDGAENAIIETLLELLSIEPIKTENAGSITPKGGGDTIIIGEFIRRNDTFSIETSNTSIITKLKKAIAINISRQKDGKREHASEAEYSKHVANLKRT